VPRRSQGREGAPPGFPPLGTGLTDHHGRARQFPRFLPYVRLVGHLTEVRMNGHRVWKIMEAIAERAGVPELQTAEWRLPTTKVP
jgi:hypothetical protein